MLSICTVYRFTFSVSFSDPMECSKQKTCAECQRVGPKCGWCDDGSGTGLGRCLPGSLEAPNNETACPKDGKSKWYFMNCSGVSTLYMRFLSI